MWSSTPARFLSLEGKRLPGERKLVVIPSPSPGADMSVVVPGGRMWRILGGNVPFVASAAVANRFPGLAVTWQGVSWWLQRSPAAVVASAIVNLSFGYNVASAGTGVTGSTISVASPAGWLLDSSIVSTSTGGIQAADQYGNGNLVVEEIWLTDNDLTFMEDEIERYLTSAEQAAAQTITGAAGGG